VSQVVPVLLYHSVSDVAARRNDPFSVRVDDFRADMEAVAASGRTTMTCEQYGRGLRGEQPIPDRPILVTFDDGFADFAEHALPILRALGLTSTLFMTTAWMDTPEMLSVAALRDIQPAGDVEIGAHSQTHPHLDVIPREAAGREIAGSKADLEDRLQAPVHSFAYPHGSHRRTTRALTIGAGYANAVGVKNALSHTEDDPYAIARFTVQSRTTRDLVRTVIDGGGAPMAVAGERLRTSAFRVVRYARHRTAAR
jgi:peptidoglycan/xylan/chitin deacetylase (PgdA/CDA1 family)